MTFVRIQMQEKYWFHLETTEHALVSRGHDLLRNQPWSVKRKASIGLVFVDTERSYAREVSRPDLPRGTIHLEKPI